MTLTSHDSGRPTPESGPPADDAAASRLFRTTDWSASTLGPMEEWPDSLTTLLDLVLNSVAPTALVWGEEMTILFNDAWTIHGHGAEALGRPAGDAAERPWPTLAPALADLMANRKRGSFPAGDGSGVFRLSPVYAGGAEPAGVLVQPCETTPPKAEWLSFALDFGGLAIWDWDLETDRVEWSAALCRMHGHEPEEVTPSLDLWLSRVHPDDREAATASLQAAREGRSLYESTYRIVRPDGSVLWYRSRGEPRLGSDGTPVRILGTAQDITEYQAALENQKALLAELQHRVRNNLAVIRSIVRRTAETSPDVDHYASHLEGRIDAIARVQTLLVRSMAGGIDLESVLREELLAAIADPEGGEIDGPPLALTAKAAETLSLAFNELATNALKFGALGNDGGRLAVRWRVEEAEPLGVLHLSWIELGQRLTDAPRHSGFGMELLTRTLPYDFSARVSVDFPPEGFRCEIALPLTPRVRSR